MLVQSCSSGSIMARSSVNSVCTRKACLGRAARHRSGRAAPTAHRRRPARGERFTGLVMLHGGGPIARPAHRLLAESPGLLETPFRAARPPLSTHLRPPVLARPSAHLASPDGRLAQAQAQAHPKGTTATAHGSSSSRRSPHTPPRRDLMITSTPAGSQWRGCPPPTARPSQQCERQRPKVDVALWTRRSWNPLET